MINADRARTDGHATPDPPEPPIDESDEREPEQEQQERHDDEITTYEIRDGRGEIVAYHCRRGSGPTKRVWWESGERDPLTGRRDRHLPDVDDGHGGQRRLGVAELPLYGIHQLGDAPITEPLVVVEGEKSRDALRAHGFHGLGTVTGAAICPNDPALAPLVEPVDVDGTLRHRRIVLWADNDEPGRKHMKAIGAALIRIGVGSVELTWGTEAGDDAADFFQRGETPEQLHALIAELPRVDDRGRVVCQAHDRVVGEGRPRSDEAIVRVRRFQICSTCLERGQRRELVALYVLDARRIVVGEASSEQIAARQDRERLQAIEHALTVAEIQADARATMDPWDIIRLTDMITPDNSRNHRQDRDALLDHFVEACVSMPGDFNSVLITARPVFQFHTVTIRTRIERTRLERLAAVARDDAAPLTEEQIAALRERAAPVLDAANPLDEIGTEGQRLGWGGDVRPLKIVYLNASSRLLPRRRGALPCHTQANGPSGSGKTYLLELTVKEMFPPSTYVWHDATSSKVMIHDPASLHHRVMVYAEADSLPGVAHGEEENPAASMLRTVLASGEAVYKVVVTNRSGPPSILEIRKEGPTVLLTTTVNRLKAGQLDSRCFALDIPEDRTQQGAALDAQAALEAGAATPTAGDAFLAVQEYLQALAPIRVIVPYVRAFFSLLHQSRVDSRLLRDAQRLLSLIKCVAILNMTHRQRNASGQILATLDDYQTMADLIDDMYEGTVTGATVKVREVVHAVRAFGLRGVSITALATAQNVSRQAISKHVTTAIANGWLMNAEERKGYPARLLPNEPLPHRCGLPSRAQIEQWRPPRDPVRPPVTRDPVR